MILLQLFWNFLVIGAVSFGGGYGMISLVRETVLGHGWLTESEFLSFIAVSESTPGQKGVDPGVLHQAVQRRRNEQDDDKGGQHHPHRCRKGTCQSRL